MLDLGASRQKM